MSHLPAITPHTLPKPVSVKFRHEPQHHASKTATRSFSQDQHDKHAVHWMMATGNTCTINNCTEDNTCAQSVSQQQQQVCGHYVHAVNQYALGCAQHHPHHHASPSRPPPVPAPCPSVTRVRWAQCFGPKPAVRVHAFKPQQTQQVSPGPWGTSVPAWYTAEPPNTTTGRGVHPKHLAGCQ